MNVVPPPGIPSSILLMLWHHLRSLLTRVGMSDFSFTPILLLLNPKTHVPEGMLGLTNQKPTETDIIEGERCWGRLEECGSGDLGSWG